MSKDFRTPNLASSYICTGCTACSSICPYHCISMEPNQEGFLLPKINLQICPMPTKGTCGICEDICPVLHPKYINFSKPQCFAIQANREERLLSSSGAFVPIIIKHILNNSNNVFFYGAVWDLGWKVIHKEFTKLEDINKIRGSKYIQSDPKNTFSEAKRRLKNGFNVIYTGTPCEIAGLYSILGKTSTEKLLTIENVCHGVASQKVLEKFLKFKYGDINLISGINFRDKEQGWISSMAVSLKDGTIDRLGPRNLFMEAFNPCLVQRTSCGVCPYAKLPRQADFSCGDFWGVEKFIKSLDNEGTSFVLINSTKGQAIFDKAKIDFELIKKVPIDEPYQINKTIKHPFKNNPGRKHFYFAFDLKPFDILLRNSLNHHYDIGIVGLWFGINYGSILTYFALYKLLTNLGYDCVMLPRPNNLWPSLSKHFDNPSSIAQKFIWNYCNVFCGVESQFQFNIFNDLCDIFVLGSDVVWNYLICGKDVGYFYFLDWVNSSKKKIAFASSFGNASHLPTNILPVVKSFLTRFFGIAVRESSALSFLQNLLGPSSNIPLTQVLDPVFLIDKSVYYRLLDKIPTKTNKLFVYLLLKNSAKLKIQLINYLSKKFNLNITCCANPWEKETIQKHYKTLKFIDLDVEHWIYEISSSSFYLGDSYHGLCFSLIFHIPFLIIYPDIKVATVERFKSLLSLVGLENRLLDKDYIECKDLEKIVSQPINWEKVDRILSEKKSYSIKWLKDILSQPQPQADKEIIRLERIISTLFQDNRKINQLEKQLNIIASHSFKNKLKNQKALAHRIYHTIPSLLKKSFRFFSS